METEGEKLWGDGGRNWTAVGTGKIMPRAAGHHEAPGKAESGL